MTPNETMLRTFAEQFTPPLTCGPTMNINGIPRTDAWTASFHDDATGVGVTAMVFDTQKMSVFLTAVDADPVKSGIIMAQALGKFEAK